MVLNICMRYVRLETSYVYPKSYRQKSVTDE